MESKCYRVADSKGTGVTFNMTFRDARIFQSNLHRMMNAKTHIECWHEDHIPSGWARVANSTKGA